MVHASNSKLYVVTSSSLSCGFSIFSETQTGRWAGAETEIKLTINSRPAIANTNQNIELRSLGNININGVLEVVAEVEVVVVVVVLVGSN